MLNILEYTLTAKQLVLVTLIRNITFPKIIDNLLFEMKLKFSGFLASFLFWSSGGDLDVSDANTLFDRKCNSQKFSQPDADEGEHPRLRSSLPEIKFRAASCDQMKSAFSFQPLRYLHGAWATNSQSLNPAIDTYYLRLKHSTHIATDSAAEREETSKCSAAVEWLYRQTELFLEQYHKLLECDVLKKPLPTKINSLLWLKCNKNKKLFSMWDYTLWNIVCFENKMKIFSNNNSKILPWWEIFSILICFKLCCLYLQNFYMILFPILAVICRFLLKAQKQERAKRQRRPHFFVISGGKVKVSPIFRFADSTAKKQNAAFSLFWISAQKKITLLCLYQMRAE